MACSDLMAKPRGSSTLLHVTIKFKEVNYRSLTEFDYKVASTRLKCCSLTGDGLPVATVNSSGCLLKALSSSSLSLVGA